MPQPRDYCRIELGGTFDLNWTDYDEDVMIHEYVEQGTIRSTILVGHPRDLEACFGLLHMLVDWGFPVQAFEYRQATSSEAVVGNSRLPDSAHVTADDP